MGLQALVHLVRCIGCASVQGMIPEKPVQIRCKLRAVRLWGRKGPRDSVVVHGPGDMVKIASGKQDCRLFGEETRQCD